MSSLQKGDRISNYLLEARVGAGSFGEVWRARHHMFGDTVAIKVPTDPEYVRNLQREGVAIHGIRHPNIVRAIDLDPYADPAYYVMEYVEGPSLREAIDHYGREFPIDSAVTIMRGLLQALTASHDKNLIHRDIKPANILLNHPLDTLASITDQAVKVTDFGLGRVGGDMTQSIMQSGSLLTDQGKSIAGTLAYMSPEQKEGSNIDGRSDLYACGIVLFEMLTGERPQGADSPGSLRPEVPAHLDDVFQRSYTRVSCRFASAEEMLVALSAGTHRPAAHGQTPLKTASFSYEARSQKGRRIKDQVDAHSEEEALAKIRSLGYFPTRICKDRDDDARGSGGTAATQECPACKNAVHPDDNFCITCGRQLAERVARCPNEKCRAYVNRNDKFCILCRADLSVLAR